MNHKRNAVLSALALVTGAIQTQAALAAPTTEESLAKAAELLEAEKPLAAKTALTKLLKSLEKKDDKTNLVRVHELLGQLFEKEERFPEALKEFESALSLSRELSLDSAGIQGRLDRLKSRYRTVDFSEIDKDKKLAELTKSAGTLNLESSQKVKIELTKTIKQDSKEFMGQKPNEPASDGKETATGAQQPKDESQQLKQIRFDKKIGFEVQQEGENQKIRVKNIEGIFFDVGLWVKLKELVLSIKEDDPKPGLDVTAGKFGVEKTVHVDLPQEALKHIRKGLGILDPFLGITPAQAATENPQQKETAPADNNIQKSTQQENVLPEGQNSRSGNE